MNNILRFEFHKLFKQKSFFICTGVMFAFTFLAIVILEVLVKNAPVNMAGLITTPQSCWDVLLTTIDNSNFILISSIFIAIFICEDFSNGAIKNIYSRGITKTQVFISKLIVVVTAALIMFALNLVFSLLVGLIFYGGNSFDVKYLWLILSQIPLVLASTTFAFAVSFISKKMGPSIAISILGLMIISLFFSLADAALAFDNFKISELWIEGMMTKLGSITSTASEILTSIACCVIYTTTFIVLSFCINKTQENY